MAEKMCPCCGSRQTEKRNNYFFCRNCGRDFGRDKETRDGKDMKQELTGIRFAIGDIDGNSYHLRIAKDDAVDAIIYEVYSARDGVIRKNADVISREEAVKLRDALVDDCFVCDWDLQYYPVNDGKTLTPDVHWRLDLITKDDDDITIHGDDAWPPYFKTLVKMLNPFFETITTENDRLICREIR